MCGDCSAPFGDAELCAACGAPPACYRCAQPTPSFCRGCGAPVCLAERCRAMHVGAHGQLALVPFSAPVEPDATLGPAAQPNALLRREAALALCRFCGGRGDKQEDGFCDEVCRRGGL